MNSGSRSQAYLRRPRARARKERSAGVSNLQIRVAPIKRSTCVLCLSQGRPDLKVQCVAAWLN